MMHRSQCGAAFLLSSPWGHGVAAGARGPTPLVWVLCPLPKAGRAVVCFSNGGCEKLFIYYFCEHVKGDLCCCLQCSLITLIMIYSVLALFITINVLSQVILSVAVYHRAGDALRGQFTVSWFDTIMSSVAIGERQGRSTRHHLTADWRPK